jgi:hypothetical protein
MTKEEAAIVSAYTGILIGDIRDFKTYGDEKMIGYQTPVDQIGSAMIHFYEELKNRAKQDFLNIKIDG